MTSRERVQRTLKFQNPDRPPRELWALPGVGQFRRAELDALQARFEWDFTGPRGEYGRSERARGDYLSVAPTVDEWGVTWVRGEPGVVGEVRQAILADDAEIGRYRLPWELLDNATFVTANAEPSSSDKFVRAGTQARPFERLQFLRGSERLLADLAYGTPAVMGLLGQLHEFFVREMEMWAGTTVDGVSFMDDWGAQNSLLISPAMWRQIFKPLYADYCRIMHRAGKSVFFHSDGHIADIIPDLIEIGVDAVNSQLFCMDIEQLAATHKGHITFWGEMDRQHILPFGSADDVRDAVRRVRRALDDGRGGVIAQCEWGLRDPAANVAAVYETWDEPRPA